MTSDEPLPVSILGQAIVCRVPTSPKHEFYTFFCSVQKHEMPSGKLFHMIWSFLLLLGSWHQEMYPLLHYVGVIGSIQSFSLLSQGSKPRSFPSTYYYPAIYNILNLGKQTVEVLWKFSSSFPGIFYCVSWLGFFPNIQAFSCLYKHQQWSLVAINIDYSWRCICQKFMRKKRDFFERYKTPTIKRRLLKLAATYTVASKQFRCWSILTPLKLISSRNVKFNAPTEIKIDFIPTAAAMGYDLAN